MFLLIIEQSLITLPLLFGAYITLSLLKLPDFSLESAYLFGAVAAYLAKEHSLPLLIGSSLLGGMLVGILVCCLNEFVKLPFLLASIVANGLLHGFSQLLLGASSVSFHPAIGISEISLLVIIGVSLFGIMALLNHSPLGYCFAIYGNNPLFFQNHAISGRYILFVGVLIAHGCAGLSGLLFAKINGFVDLSMNFGVILLCLTALMLGKLLFRHPRPRLLIPLVGILGFFTIQQMLLRLGLDLRYFNSFQALFVLLILFLGQQKTKTTLNLLGT